MVQVPPHFRRIIMYDYENYKFRHVTGARVYDAIGKTYMKSKARPGPLPLLRIGSHELQQIEARHELQQNGIKCAPDYTLLYLTRYRSIGMKLL